MVQILAEPPLAHGQHEVVVARGQDPRVDRLHPGAAEAAHRPLLERLEELGLEPVRQETHLVEEERAVARRLEQPGLAVARVGECAPLVPEQLRFQEGLGDRRAVDVDERAGAPGARAMKGSGEEALADTRLTLDEDRGEPPAVGATLEEPPGREPEGGEPGAPADQLCQRVHGPPVSYSGGASAHQHR